MNGLENIEESTFTEKKFYDAVVVLGGVSHLKISNKKHIEFIDSVERILKGIELVKLGKARNLVITGGNGSLFQDGKSEAVFLREFAIRQGVDKRRILIDPLSRNTWQNSVNTKTLIKDKRLEEVLMITSAFHMFRAKGCFRKAGLKVDILPVDYRSAPGAFDFYSFLPSTTALYLSNIVIHEVVGIIVYGIAGRAKYH